MKTLTPEAQKVLNEYLHFPLGSAVCNVPYVNNKVLARRGALPVQSGKGSPQEIADELKSVIVYKHVNENALDDVTLKKLLVESDLGIECSGFVYNILDVEAKKRGISLSKAMKFVNCRGIFGRFICSLRPKSNCDVTTFADNANSKVIPISAVEAGDFVTMISSTEKIRNHIILVHTVEKREDKVAKLFYTHAIAYAEDGVNGTGVRQGEIEITDPEAPITKQTWREGGKANSELPLYVRAGNSQTELRRLLAFMV